MNFRPEGAGDFVAYALISLAVFVSSIGIAEAEGVKSAIPANATVKPYGSGWECDRGFRKTGGACVVVAVPDNAYLPGSAYGSGWDCNKPYIKRMQTCTLDDRND